MIEKLAPKNEIQASFWDHLENFRVTLIRSLLSIILAVFICFLFFLENECEVIQFLLNYGLDLY